jgi:glycerophosphodiester phosphodiesterase
VLLIVIQLQKNEGIDAVIVDSVLKVRQGLQAPNQDAAAGVTNGTTFLVPQTSVATITEANEVLQAGQNRDVDSTFA